MALDSKRLLLCYHCVSKTRQLWQAVRSFKKHGLILIIFFINSISTLSKMIIRIQLSLSLYFYLLYLLLNSGDTKWHKTACFSGRLVLKRVGGIVCWLWKVPVLVLADVQNDVVSPSFLHVQSLSPLTNCFVDDTLTHTHTHTLLNSRIKRAWKSAWQRA